MKKEVLNNLEDYFKIYKEANPYFIALKTYLEIPRILNHAAYIVLTHFFHALSPESKIIFKSYRNIKKSTGLEYQTIRTALKELYLKGMISYISGRYDKELAFKARKQRFEEKAKKSRSFYEINTYDLTGALKFAWLIQYLKDCAKSKGLPPNNIEKMVIEIIQIFEAYTAFVMKKHKILKSRHFLTFLGSLVSRT